MTDRIKERYLGAEDDIAEDDEDDTGSNVRHVDEAVLDIVREMSDGKSGASAGMVTTTTAASRTPLTATRARTRGESRSRMSRVARTTPRQSGTT